jgi:hypothetical protein
MLGSELGVDAGQLVDFWHAVEKLGRAAQVIHGASGAMLVSFAALEDQDQGSGFKSLFGSSRAS